MHMPTVLDCIDVKVLASILQYSAIGSSLIKTYNFISVFEKETKTKKFIDIDICPWCLIFQCQTRFSAIILQNLYGSVLPNAVCTTLQSKMDYPSS